MFSAKIILDSLAPCGKRLTTIEARFPRFILAEMNTHRDRARNSASSRAIPFPKMLAAVTAEPVLPLRWGSEQRGMQTGGEIANPVEADRVWLEARDNAVKSAQALADLGVHKSLCNRLVEPWMWITVIMTATEWRNFFRLRCHPDAEIHFQKIATMILDVLNQSVPLSLAVGDWHLPFIQPNERDLPIETLQRISVARCARVSYLTHDGKRDIAADVSLFERLMTGSGFGHLSPHEHVAEARGDLVRSGPFVGWKQFRKSIPNECAD